MLDIGGHKTRVHPTNEPRRVDTGFVPTSHGNGKYKQRTHPAKFISTRQAGFSLLEVLVAFAILSMSLGVLYQVFSNSLRGSALTGHYSRAMIIAESQLALAMEEVPLKELSEQGSVEEIYHWKVDVSRFVEEEEPKRGGFAPYQIKVRVNWSEGKGQRHYDLTTLRLGEP